LTTKDLAELARRCEPVIGYHFDNADLLLSALTHSSKADTRLQSNERLEFLGDAILGVVVCEQLFERFPQLMEGDLTKIKSVVVSRRTCASVSRSLGLGRFLRLGKGMTTGAAIPSSLLANVFESLTAAIYLDGGIGPAREFILHHMAEEIERTVSCHHGGNYKSALQQTTQKDFGQTPHYHSLDEKGPDHARCFKVCAVIDRRRFPGAWGASKKDAEQIAALNALRLLQAEGVASVEHLNLPPEQDA